MRPAPGTASEFIGIQKSNGYTWEHHDGVFAGLQVTNPYVQRGTQDYLAQRLLTKTCDNGSWLEIGWAEVGWRGDAQYIYTYDSVSRAWTFYDQYVLGSGTRFYAEIYDFTGDNSTFDAMIYWNGGWNTLRRVTLGANAGCGVEFYTDPYYRSSGKPFTFSQFDYGDQTPSGVQIADNSGFFSSWTPAIPTQYNGTEGYGNYDAFFPSQWYKGYAVSRNYPPNAALTVTPSSGGKSTTFTADMRSSTDPNGDPLTYRINWGDGATTTGATGSHRYAWSGTYTVTGTVTDPWGSSSSFSRTVTVVNSPPEAALTVSPAQGDLTTTFHASMSGSRDPDGDFLSYRIDWGDETQTNGSSGSHQYAAPGDYDVTGTVTDNEGASSSAHVTVRVCALNAATCVGVQPPPDPCQSAPCETDPVNDPCITAPGLCPTSGQLDEAQADALDAAPAGVGSPGIDSPLCPGGTLNTSNGDCLYTTRINSTSPPPLETAPASNAYCQQQDNRNRHVVVYTFIGRGNNRVEQVKSSLRNGLQNADNYARLSGSVNGGNGRHIRYDCGGGVITVRDVRLSRHAREDGPSDANKDATDEAMAEFRTTALYKQHAATRRFIVFLDWDDPTSTSNSALCGGGEVTRSADGPGPGNPNNERTGRIAAVYLKPSLCSNHLGHVSFHEIGHTLGAVLEGAPNEVSGHAGDRHDALDVGSRSPVCGQQYKNRWDCNGNDYFNTSVTLPARRTWLADRDEFTSGRCQRIADPDDPDGGRLKTGCHWNTAWSKWLIR